MPKSKTAAKAAGEPKIVAKSQDKTLGLSQDVIDRELRKLLDGLTLLTPAQMAAIMQTTVDQLQTMREVGDGPPFVKLGDGSKAPVRYPLAKYLEWLEGHTFSNTSQVNVSRFASFADFMSSGSIDDSYAIAIDAQGMLSEFWESIRQQQDVVEVRWMRMDEMLDGLRRQANLRREQAADAEVEGGVPVAKKSRATNPGHADSI